jgi:hypothetical protein
MAAKSDFPGTARKIRVVGQFEKLSHYQYQSLAIRSRIAGSPDRAAFARDGVQIAGL